MTKTTNNRPAALRFRMTPAAIDEERSMAQRLVSLHRDKLDEHILQNLTSDNPANVHVGLEDIKPWLMLRKQEREAAALKAAFAPLLPEAENRYKALKARVRYARQDKRARIRLFIKRFEDGFNSVDELQQWIKEAGDKLAAIDVYRRGTTAPKGCLGHVHANAQVDWDKQDSIPKADADYVASRVAAGMPTRGVTQPGKRNGDGTKKR